MKKIMIAASLSILVACATYKPVVPTQTDADRAAQKYPGITLADLNKGKAIFEERCKKCHSPQRPFNKSEAKVIKALPRMAKKAHLDSEEEKLVTQFVLTMKPVAKQR